MQVIAQYRVFARTAPCHPTGTGAKSPSTRSSTLGSEGEAELGSAYAGTTIASRTDIDTNNDNNADTPPPSQGTPIISGPGPEPRPDHQPPPAQAQAQTQASGDSKDPALTEHESKYQYVTFPPGDPSNPQNWSLGYKNWVVLQLTLLTLSLTFGSSVSSSASAGARAEFGAGELGGTATTGAFVVGVGVGAMPFAPLSELYGRLPVYLSTILLATLFELSCALAPSMPALIILRFFCGLFSAPPLSNAGGTLVDIGNPVFRTLALPFFTGMGFIGPILGPIIGSYIAESGLGWRWCYWVTAIWNAAAFGLVATCMPETLGGALLKYKAIAWRRAAASASASAATAAESHPSDHAGLGEEGVQPGSDVEKKARLDTHPSKRIWRAKVEDETFDVALARNLKRPFQMLVREPILVLFSIYLTVVYTVLYGLFEAYPIVFSRRGLSPTEIGLTFIPVLVGFLLLYGLTFWHFVRYRRLHTQAMNGERGRIEPEERLVPLMISNFLFPAGLFWFAWTSDPKFSIWVTMISGIPCGFGLLAIFQGSFQYLMDAYGPYAASALAGLTLTRYGISGLVTLAYPTMYRNLGSEWAGSVFAFLGLALMPVPFLFYIYGRRIRAKCSFTVHT